MRRLYHWTGCNVIVTKITLCLSDFVAIHVAYIALAVAVEHVATVKDVLDHEAVHVAMSSHAIHAPAMIVDYYDLCTDVVVAVIVNCGICLTENCCCAEDHHSDYHHAEILCCHCYVVFCESCDSGLILVVSLFLGAKLKQKTFT